MVSFRSLSLLASVFMVSGSHAAPAAGSGATHVSAPDPAFKLPPLISTRTQTPKTPAFAGDLNAEAISAAKNKKWWAAHGGNVTELDKRDTTTVGGMTLTLQANPPAITTTSSSTVVAASSAQISNFKFYAGIASTAYCSSVVPNNQWTCSYCTTYVPDGKLVSTFTSAVGKINGFILRSDAQKVIYLAFRGTSNFQNWIVDLAFGFTTYTPVSGAHVHAGFYTAAKELSSYYFSTLQAQHNAYPEYKVIITGHSLGGAISLLAGMDLYQRISTLTPSNLNIYTVGCPRVGDPTFAYYVENSGIPFSRSVNNRDIVPHVPPQSFGYLHPGVEAWALSTSKLQICTPDIETNSCSNTIVPFTSISDHLTYYGLSEGTCV